MKKVLLVKLKEPSSTCTMPPLGLYTLKAVLQDQAEVLIVDEQLGDKIRSIATFFKPDIIGISAQFSIQHRELLRVAKYAKSLGTRVIAGGFHASILETIPNVDEIIRGPGEKRLCEILGLESPREHVYPKWDKDTLKPYWDLNKPHNLKSKTTKWVSLETSRGCNFLCGFCGVQNFWDLWVGFRLHNISKHIKHLEEIGIQEVFIEDDNVSYDKVRFFALLRYLKMNNMWWSVPNGICVKDLDTETIQHMSDSHCWRVSLPFETGTKKSAELMNLEHKWVPFEEALRICEELKSHHILTAGFFVIGYPGETLEDVRKTLDYANALPLDDRYVYIATPYPGTALYELCKVQKYLICDNEELYDELRYTKCLIKTPWIKPEELEAIRRKDHEEHGRD